MADRADASGVFNNTGGNTYDLYGYLVRTEVDNTWNGGQGRSRFQAELYARFLGGTNQRFNLSDQSFGFVVGGNDFTVVHNMDMRGTSMLTLGVFDAGWYAHDANGNLNLNMRVATRANIPQFGLADSGNVWFAVDRIPQLPSAPGTPSLSLPASTSIRGAWTAAPGNGDTILEYEFQVSTSSTFASGNTSISAGTALNATITGRPYNTQHWGRARARTARGWGPYSAASSITTNPDVPAAPGTPTITRVSDTQQTVAWSRNASVAKPVASQNILRRVHTGSWGAFGSVGSIAADYTTNGTHSWSDTGTVANRIYQYQVKAANPAGEATSPSSVLVYTTPAAPSSVSAVRQPSGSIDITIAQGVLHSDYKTTLEYSTDGGSTWIALATLNSGVLNYTMSSPPGGSSVQFRARVVIDATGAIGNGLVSTNRVSNTVTLITPPNPPSALNPTGVVFDAGAARTFGWQHNPVDSSAQTAYELRYRIGTGAYTSTGKITSAVQSRLIAAATFVNGQAYNWQVRTWGAHADPSNWSDSATFTTSAPPTVAITGPSGTVGVSTATATWTYYDAEGTAQSAWESQLLYNAVVAEERSGSGTATSVTFNTRLVDAGSYQVRARVRDGSGLWSNWDQSSFVTDFFTPSTPLLAGAFASGDGTVKLTIVNPAAVPGVTIAAVSNTLQRSTDGGLTWVEIASDLPLNSAFSDPTAPLGQSVLYKVEAWSALPSVAESAVLTVDTTTVAGYWSAGAGFQVVIPMRVGYKSPPKIDLESGLAQKTLHYFAGRTLPVEASGDAILRTGKASFLITNLQDRAVVAQLALLPAPHLFRLPDGTHLFASIGNVSEARVDRDAYTISLPLQEVEQ